jgi:ABC-2 type transport system ATP-binding protein
MNTHILSDVESICDRVAIIVDGEVRYQGRIADFLMDEEHHCDVLASGLRPELVEELEAHLGVVSRGVAERIEFRVEEKDLSEILSLILQSGAQVISVTPHRVSLESIFLSTIEQGGAK